MAYSVNTTPLLQDCDSENEEIKDELTDIRDNKPLFNPIEPKDRFYTAYLIFYLLGIVTLLPWNFYITADDYWMFKFRNISKDETSVAIAAMKNTTLQAEFTSYLSVASAVPNLIFLVLNTAISHRVSLNTRIIGSLVSMLFFMILTLVFVKIDTDKWQHLFFIITLTAIVLLNVCSAILSGSIFGVMGKFSHVYITATIGGQALGGIFAAIAEIVSLSVGASSTHSAFVYFIIGNVTIFLSIVAYIFLIKTSFFKYHAVEKLANFSKLDSESVAPQVSYKIVLRKIWVYGVSMFLVFAITLAVYPGVTVLVESEGKGHGNKWNDVFFVPTICYLLFNVGDYLGRIFAGRFQKPRSGIYLLILSLSRFIFIPLLMLCNAHPRYYWDVVFDKDYQYIIILLLCSLSNGYLANIAAICAPRVVDHHEKELASLIVTIFLGVGLALGSGICLVMVKLL